MLSGDFYYGLSNQDFWDFPCIFQDFYYGLPCSCHCHFVRAIKSPNRPSGLSAPKCGLPLFANIATCIIMKGYIRLWLNG